MGKWRRTGFLCFYSRLAQDVLATEANHRMTPPHPPGKKRGVEVYIRNRRGKDLLWEQGESEDLLWGQVGSAAAATAGHVFLVGQICCPADPATRGGCFTLSHGWPSLCFISCAEKGVPGGVPCIRNATF